MKRTPSSTSIPHARVVELAKRVEGTNSWRFLLRESVWSVADVRDVTEDLRKGEQNWVGTLAEEAEVAR